MLASDFTGLFYIVGYYLLVAVAPFAIAFVLSIASVQRASRKLATGAALALMVHVGVLVGIGGTGFLGFLFEPCLIPLWFGWLVWCGWICANIKRGLRGSDYYFED